MSESNIPLSGKLVKAVVANFCQKPIQGDDTWEHMSLGVSENSVVATDTSSAIMIGTDAEGHVATQRKEVLLEAERASLYGDPVRIDGIDRNCDAETGEAKPMPHIRAHIRKQLSGMAPIATVNPTAKAVGIELPNRKARRVDIGEICARREFVDSEAPLTMALGLDTAGAPVYCDLASTPHLLIAGATNSGKSIGVASMLCSLLLRNTPKEMRLVLIDPKQVELSLFDGVPHLACPVITDALEVPGVLRAVVREMERRYDMLKEAGVRNITGWNAKASFQDRLPYFVVVIDELADLMMQAKAEVESSIVRLAQKARAVGIHLIVATQRPSVDVITGLIKANIPSRIAYSVASQVDSRVILDENGAEKLLGRGDMLFKAIDSTRVVRLQGAYVGEETVAAVCGSWKDQQIATRFEIIVHAERDSDSESDAGADAEDPLYSEATLYVRERGQASTSMLQRKFSIGFRRAMGILDLMEERGVVGPRDGPRPRKVLEAVAGG